MTTVDKNLNSTQKPEQLEQTLALKQEIVKENRNENLTFTSVQPHLFDSSEFGPKTANELSNSNEQFQSDSEIGDEVEAKYEREQQKLLNEMEAQIKLNVANLLSSGNKELNLYDIQENAQLLESEMLNKREQKRRD